ncbi:MAG: hypothetical protein Q4E03_04115 [Trueperella sp.]|nr:hypothetical protein [Trueperella sp.]
MDTGQIAILVVALLVAIIGIAGLVLARKLDRLHKNVVRSRVMLERALRERSLAAFDVANSGVLDMAGAILLAEAASQAANASAFPIVEDGLSAIEIRDAEGNVVVSEKAGTAYTDRLALESELSRTLRYTVDELADVELAGIDAAGTERLERLERARDQLRMTRLFHNTRVTRVRTLRTHPFVRVLHLQGTAPLPRTVDLDDI